MCYGSNTLRNTAFFWTFSKRSLDPPTLFWTPVRYLFVFKKAKTKVHWNWVGPPTPFQKKNAFLSGWLTLVWHVGLNFLHFLSPLFTWSGQSYDGTSRQWIFICQAMDFYLPGKGSIFARQWIFICQARDLYMPGNGSIFARQYICTCQAMNLYLPGNESIFAWRYGEPAQCQKRASPRSCTPPPGQCVHWTVSRLLWNVHSLLIHSV